jgi:deoxycytidylate deaminase
MFPCSNCIEDLMDTQCDYVSDYRNDTEEELKIAWADRVSATLKISIGIKSVISVLIQTI